MNEKIKDYIERYRGPIVIHKLQLLALSKHEVAEFCLNLATQYAKQNNYIGFYEEIYNVTVKNPKLDGIKLNPREDAWVSTVSAKYKEKSQKKENDIIKAISNQMREGIRVSLYIIIVISYRGRKY